MPTDAGFFAKLWKRRVVQAAVVYLGVSWVALQVAIAVEDTLALPDWVDQLILLLLLVGLPVVILIAWVQPAQRAPAWARKKPAPGDSADGDFDETAGETPKVLVLPFLNLSDDPDKDYLADGMTEDLIGGLSQSRHLSVSARSISFAYKGDTPNVRKIGRELNVDYVVEGSVRPYGSQIRFTVQLIDAGNGRQIWAKRFDQPIEQLFEVQDEMINRVAAALGAQLSVAEAERATRLRPDDLTSWQATQRSLKVLQHTLINKDEVDKGIALLEQVVKKNPDYAYGRAALAWFLIMRVVNYCSDDISRDMEKYLDHLGVAASMMGDDPYAMMLVGSAFAFGGKHEEAMGILNRAVELNPASTDPYVTLGVVHAYRGEYEVARATLQKARELSHSGGFAVNYDWFEALSYTFEGNFERALPMLTKLAAAHPMFPAIHILIAVAQAALGNTRDVPDAIAKAIHASPLISLEYLKLVPYTHPERDEHLRRVALIEQYWPGDDGAKPS